MHENSVILAQIDTLNENLHRAIQALEKIDPEIRKNAYNRFVQLIGENQNKIGILQNQVVTLQLEQSWSSFKNVREESRNILKECLAFIEGALLRHEGIDDGICQIADSLLLYLSNKADIKWNRITLMAETEFFAEMTEIIRMRFPETSIWNLPIACHELGHFTGESKFNSLLKEILQSEPKSQQKTGELGMLKEQFADLFAVYTIGPAFACTCIFLHFNPDTADLDGKDHPSDAKRVYFILKALEKMDEPDFMRPYAGISGKLRNLWEMTLTAAGKSDINDQLKGQLNYRLERLYVPLNNSFRNVKYTGSNFNTASSLSFELLSYRNATQLLNDFHNLSLPDVLNAAWLCRLDNLDKQSRISDKSLEICHEIVKHSVNNSGRRNVDA